MEQNKKWLNAPVNIDSFILCWSTQFNASFKAICIFCYPLLPQILLSFTFAGGPTFHIAEAFVLHAEYCGLYFQLSEGKLIGKTYFFLR